MAGVVQPSFLKGRKAVCSSGDKELTLKKGKTTRKKNEHFAVENCVLEVVLEFFMEK